MTRLRQGESSSLPDDEPGKSLPFARGRDIKLVGTFDPGACGCGTQCLRRWIVNLSRSVARQVFRLQQRHLCRHSDRRTRLVRADMEPPPETGLPLPSLFPPFLPPSLLLLSLPSTLSLFLPFPTTPTSLTPPTS